MMASKALMEARKKFGNQKKVLERNQYDDSNIPEGKYTCRVAESEVRDRDIKGVTTPVHYMRVVVDLGEYKGRGLFPFSPRLDEEDGIQSCASNLIAIKGDNYIPGSKDPGGNIVLDFGSFLGQLEGLTAGCKGDLIEVTVKNSPSARKPNGEPRQNVYINRGLGADAVGRKTPDEALDGDDLSYGVTPDQVGPGKKNPPARKTAKKKVAKKKVAKKTTRK
jgi:hypothetical protein